MFCCAIQAAQLKKVMKESEAPQEIEGKLSHVTERDLNGNDIPTHGRRKIIWFRGPALMWENLGGGG